jgi:MurNAc alpha-1-phosphate uridylyltransferase
VLKDAPAGAFSLTRVWRRAAAEGRLHGLVHDGLWFHVGTPGDLAEAQRYLDELRLLVPERTD